MMPANGRGRATRFPPLGGPLPKKRGGPLHTLKMLLQIVSPPLNFWGGPKMVGHYTHTKNTLCEKTIFRSILVFFFQFTGSTFPEIECLKGGRWGGGSQYSESRTVLKDWSQLSELPSSSLVIHLMFQVLTLLYNLIKMTWKQACSELFSQ